MDENRLLTSGPETLSQVERLVKRDRNHPCVISYSVGNEIGEVDGTSDAEKWSTLLAEEIRKYFGNKVFDTVIPRNIRVSEAPSHGLPVMLHDKRCRGAVAYVNLVDEYLAKNNK